MSGRRLATGIREEEICRILNLKKNLDYSDILVNYATKYVKIGWHLAAVNLKGDTALDLDFRESQEVWSEKLTGWGLEGLQVNLGVRTGSLSRLMVLEVHREESQAPFNRRGDWCSGCVAELGLDREQHYYALPKGWQPPPSFFLEAFQVMVFGEGGLVLAPPSLEPRAQGNLRWLRPPWENPPSRPSHALCKFITDHAPRMAAHFFHAEPVALPWARIYPAISDQPQVLQAMLALAVSPEAYYRGLLKTAREAGIEDAHILLGLLWHEPLGHTHDDKGPYLQELVTQSLAGVEDPLAAGPLNSGAGMAASDGAGAPSPEGEYEEPPGYRSDRERQKETPLRPSPKANQEVAPPWPGEEAAAQPGNGAGAGPSRVGEFSEVLSEFFRFSRESLVVERHRYEAMIYELGKLGAIQDFFKKEHRQNKALREKLENQWNTEVNFLRQQLASKKIKKGWYRSWWQE